MTRKNHLSTQFKNCCFQHGKKLILLKKKMDNEKYSCKIIKMAYLVNFYKPIQSKDLFICYVKHLKAVPCEEHKISKSKQWEFALFHGNPALWFCQCYMEMINVIGLNVLISSSQYILQNYKNKYFTSFLCFYFHMVIAHIPFDVKKLFFSRGCHVFSNLLKFEISPKISSKNVDFHENLLKSPQL